MWNLFGAKPDRINRGQATLTTTRQIGFMTCHVHPRAYTGRQLSHGVPAEIVLSQSFSSERLLLTLGGEQHGDWHRDVYSSYGMMTLLTYTHEIGGNCGESARAQPTDDDLSNHFTLSASRDRRLVQQQLDGSGAPASDRAQCDLVRSESLGALDAA